MINETEVEEKFSQLRDMGRRERIKKREKKETRAKNSDIIVI